MARSRFLLRAATTLLSVVGFSSVLVGIGVFLAKVGREGSTSEKASALAGAARAFKLRFGERSVGRIGAIIWPCSCEHIPLAITIFGSLLSTKRPRTFVLRPLCDEGAAASRLPHKEGPATWKSPFLVLPCCL